jgi:hypothetical protein
MPTPLSSKKQSRSRAPQCAPIKRRRICVVVSAVTDEHMTQREKELFVRLFERAGAANSQVNGRLARAEFKYLGTDVEAVALDVAERLDQVADLAEVLIVTGPFDGPPEFYLRTPTWSDEAWPHVSVLDAEGTLRASAAKEWLVL